MASQFPSFHGLEPQNLRWNRFYKIYVDHSALYGAWLAGQIYDELSGRQLLHSLYPLMLAWVHRCLKRRKALEHQYDHLNLRFPEWLAFDSRNFRIDRRDIADLHLHRKRTVWARNATGVLTLTFHDGTTRKFILMKDESADEVCAMLMKFFPTIRDTGTFEPCKQKLGSRKEAIWELVVSFILLLGSVWIIWSTATKSVTGSAYNKAVLCCVLGPIVSACMFVSGLRKLRRLKAPHSLNDRHL